MSVHLLALKRPIDTQRAPCCYSPQGRPRASALRLRHGHEGSMGRLLICSTVHTPLAWVPPHLSHLLLWFLQRQLFSFPGLQHIWKRDRVGLAGTALVKVELVHLSRNHSSSSIPGERACLWGPLGLTSLSFCQWVLAPMNLYSLGGLSTN